VSGAVHLQQFACWLQNCLLPPRGEVLSNGLCWRRTCLPVTLVHETDKVHGTRLYKDSMVTGTCSSSLYKCPRIAQGRRLSLSSNTTNFLQIESIKTIVNSRLKSTKSLIRQIKMVSIQISLFECQCVAFFETCPVCFRQSRLLRLAKRNRLVIRRQTMKQLIKKYEKLGV